MTPRSILCPIDFSESSRGALRYAHAIAAHLRVPLVVATIIDPVLYEAMQLVPDAGDPSDQAALEHFVKETLGRRGEQETKTELVTSLGKPAPEILRVARSRRCDLIVMSSNGLSGVRRLFFGATTERVLRETTVPVLVTPPRDAGATSLESLRAAVQRVLVPVDLTATTDETLRVAAAIAAGLDLPLLVTYVLEPVQGLARRVPLPGIDRERRDRAEQRLGTLVASVGDQGRVEGLVAYGDPAEELVKVARDRKAGLIVMGLHSSPVTGPRMGSVTYRVLCLAHTLVLAVPPAAVGGASGTGEPG